MVVSEFQEFESVSAAQASLDRICDFLGVARRSAFLTKGNDGARRRAYVRPSPEALRNVTKMWTPIVHSFFKKIGKVIPWRNFPVD